MRYGIWKPLPGNFQRTRFGQPIQAVVVHMMLGRLWGTDSHFRNPSVGASTHFGIGWPNSTDERYDRNVQTWQWVDTNDTAWGWGARPTDAVTAVGRRLNLSSPDLNRNVIHIEMANYGPVPSDGIGGWYRQAFRESQYRELNRLLTAINASHAKLFLMGHADLSAKACPGYAINWSKVGGGYGGPLVRAGAGDNDVVILPYKILPRGSKVTLRSGTTYKVFDVNVATGEVSHREVAGDDKQREAYAFVEVDGNDSHRPLMIGTRTFISAWGPMPTVELPANPDQSQVIADLKNIIAEKDAGLDRIRPEALGLVTSIDWIRQRGS